MELSQEIQDILQKYRPQRMARGGWSIEDEFVDVSGMHFDDETWLVKSNPVKDLSSFLKLDNDLVASTGSDASNDLRKPFDSRTFTRPKKKLNRPSIEKYNEEYFADDLKSAPTKTKSSLSDEIDRYISISSTTLEDGMAEKPLHFDLTQPITTSLFENIAANTSDLDSFQNMSPPSLVNSLCSSTFTNLMENSYIKNDPVLREIRDADYSNVIYQEVEPPLYQSITESCSSINTEIAETFVRKTLISLNCTFNKSQLEETIKLSDHEEDPHETQIHTENIDPNATYSSVQGTYRKNKSFNPSLNKTFECESPQTKLNKSFEIDDIVQNEFFELCEKERLQMQNLEANDDDECNTTFSLAKQTHRNSLNNTYRRDQSPKLSSKINTTFNRRTEKDKCNSTITLTPKIDNYLMDSEETGYNHKSKRLSDEIDEFLSQKISTYKDKEDKSLNQYTSSDSLDRLSSISNSSRDSKLMAEVDAIVERQERSLQQVMSTPKPAKSLNKLFEHAHLSPIPVLNLKEHLSDSEVSSEEYKTVSSKLSLQQAAKSLNNLKCAEGNKQRGIHTLSSIQRPVDTTISRPSTGSSLGNLRRQSQKGMTGSYTNLKTFSSNLKGSYTNLRPKSMILPHIPSKGAEGDVPAKLEEFKVPHMPSASTRLPASNTNSTFIKPISKLSSLPRPTGTGIPRPTSKIPGPRTSRLPLSKSKARSRSNLNEGNY